MFRFIVVFLFLLSVAQAADTMKLEVIDTQIGVNDYTDRPTLCITVARDLVDGKLLGIVEDITECFWTRKARRNTSHTLEIPRKELKKLQDEDMQLHLQAFDSQLEFLWSSND